MLGAFQTESRLNFSLTVADEGIRYERETKRERNLTNVTQPVSGTVDFFLIKNCILIQSYANKILIKITIHLAYY